MGAPKAPVCCWLLVEPNAPVLPPPNKPPPVFPPPKAGFCVEPNRPPPEVLLLLAVLPNPPNPLEDPEVAVLPPKRPLPLVVAVEPKAGRFCPNGVVLVVAAPKPPEPVMEVR